VHLTRHNAKLQTVGRKFWGQCHCQSLYSYFDRNATHDLTPTKQENRKLKKEFTTLNFHKMKLNVMFIIAAVYGFVTGLPSILAPEAMASMGGLQLPSGMLMGLRFLGVAELGLGLIAWLVRNSEASKTRDGVVLGFTIYFALHSITSLYGQFTDTSMSMHWVMATLQGLIALGFFLAGRTNMAKSNT
jgi:hypothetical protein